MTGVVWLIGAATVIFVALVAYAMTRRYGWGIAVMLPLLAFLAMIGMRWQAEGLTFAEGVAVLGPMALYASPVLVGAAVGIAVARFRRG
jgi:glucose-6-phosphate-specific signal transduction histidine kinase